ncbi:Anoctamin-7 like protein [Argiope bruennichi]|uniref:Anoctamin n=1 Tax=Argiope bruennichi TaxID=94029 RepID=A0A8T0FUD1_ARGBR|nr:Anoctamin-7 like protein [Argiope bruennichi]
MLGTSYVLVYVDPTYSLENGQEPTSIQIKMDNLRRRFLVAIRKETLTVMEERVGKHIFVKVSCPLEREYKEAENMRVELPLYGLNLDNPAEMEEAMFEKNMKKIFRDIETTPYVSAPFQRDSIELFKRREYDDSPILWSSIRCLLVYNILSNINISRYKENGELPEKIGLTYLIMVGAFKDGFCLHDPSTLEPVSLVELPGRNQGLDDALPEVDLRRVLSKKWGRLCRNSPIHDIRNYFGEKIAFYFAWVSTLMTSLWIPAILGLGIFIYGVCDRLAESEDRGLKRLIEIVKSSSDNDLTPAFAAIICLWGTIFMEVWKRKQIALARKWHVDNFDQVESDRPQFYGTKREFNRFTRSSILYYPFHKRLMKHMLSVSVLLLMVMLVFISVTSVILYRVYMTISFCFDDTFCDLLHGTIIATLLNTLSIMVLGRIYEFIAVKLTEWENHQTQSEYNDALVIKLFAFQFANTYASLFYTAFFRQDFGGPKGILGLDKKYTDNCGHKDNDNCMSLLSFQLLVLMIVKPFPKFAKDVIFPCLKKALHHCKVNEIDDFTTDEGISKQSYLLREMMKPSAEDFRLGEFTEKVIQYGYLMLFAASFPLAPALALIFNLIDFRVDSRRLLWWNRRPTPYRDNDIGIWFNIIDFINVCGVISNAFLIAFNSKLGRDRSYEIKFAIIIGFEHFIFLMKFIISLLIPDVPTWVKNSQKKDRYLVSYLLKKLNPDVNSEIIQTSEECTMLENSQNGDVQLNVFENKGCRQSNSRWSY